MKKVLLPLADGFEELEAVTVIDLLRRAGVQVSIAALRDRYVNGSHHIRIEADTLLDDALEEPFDMLVLPGGEPGATTLRDDARIIALIQRFAGQGKPVAAICAAPKALVRAGVLDGKSATSYPGYLDEAPAPGMRYLAQPVVIDGGVITSRGPGTAMDFALTLIEVLHGAEARREVEQGLMRS
jgi:4-methyl-5(b-hydroxyethyl)-thiazole monophosphate biosynthesis